MADMSVSSDSEALRFLRWLDPVGTHNLVAIDPGGQSPPEAVTFSFSDPADLGAARDLIQTRNGKRNLYFSINAPRPNARSHNKWRRDEIGALRAFHVDIDNIEGAPAWDMDCLPSAVIDSGGGRWGFWKLAAPIPADDVEALEAQNRALTGRFHGDTQAHNIDRIARLPGTINIPNASKRKKGRVEVPSRILSLTDLTYAPAEVAGWCPPVATHAAASDMGATKDQDLGVEADLPASIVQATIWLVNEAPRAIEGDNGDNTTWQVAARLKNYGVGEQTALRLMADLWNETKADPPWTYRDLADKVRNAYRHATGAFGRDSESLAEIEFEAVEVAATPSKRPRMTAESFDAIDEDFTKAPTYLIQDWYDRETLIVTYGESNSGKTHVVLDQSLAIAAGRAWGGKKVEQGLVVYVAAEGGKGVRRRVMAHRIFRPENKNLPFSLVVHPINLMHNTADTKALVALVKAEEARHGQKCVMVVVDTLSRALAGGDENSSADMGAFVKRCDEIRFATGAALHVIHHAGKNTAKGARGHSLLRAAVDTEIEIESQTILSRKQRDMESPVELRFDYKPVLIGVRGDGSEVRSVVLDVWQMGEFEPSLAPATERVWEAAHDLIVQKTQNEGAEGFPQNTPTFTPRELIALGESATTVERAIVELLGERIFAKCKRGQYKLLRSPNSPDVPPSTFGGTQADSPNSPTTL